MGQITSSQTFPVAPLPPRLLLMEGRLLVRETLVPGFNVHRYRLKQADVWDESGELMGKGIKRLEFEKSRKMIPSFLLWCRALSVSDWNSRQARKVF